MAVLDPQGSPSIELALAERPSWPNLATVAGARSRGIRAQRALTQLVLRLQRPIVADYGRLTDTQGGGAPLPGGGFMLSTLSGTHDGWSGWRLAWRGGI